MCASTGGSKKIGKNAAKRTLPATAAGIVLSKPLETKVLESSVGGLLPISIGSIPVINLSLVRVTQNFVGLLNLLESFLRRLISRIDIGMVLSRQPPV